MISSEYSGLLSKGDEDSINGIKVPLKTLCRITGILYATIIVCGIYADVGVRGSIINYTSATETAMNLQSHALKFRSSVLVELLMCCSDVGVAIILSTIVYFSVDTTESIMDVIVIALMAVFRLIQTSIIASNLLHSFAASLILDPSFAAVESAGTGLKSVSGDDSEYQLAENMALLFLSMQKYGYTLALVFFGMSLVFLGIIMNRSSYISFPEMLGMSCILAGCGYVLDAVMYFSWPGYNGQVSGFFMLPVFVAEFWLTGWLLLVKEPACTYVRLMSDVNILPPPIL